MASAAGGLFSKVLRRIGSGLGRGFPVAVAFAAGFSVCQVCQAYLYTLRESAQPLADAEEEGALDDDDSPKGDSKPLQYALEHPADEVKMVFAVRNDLKMKAGKIAAQVAHAAVEAFRYPRICLQADASQHSNSLFCHVVSHVHPCTAAQISLFEHIAPAFLAEKSVVSSLTRWRECSAAQVLEEQLLEMWEEHGCAKVCLKVDGQEQLLSIAGVCRENGLITRIIEDAGRTQVDPGTLTVCAIGPAPASYINQFTGHLKLL